MLRILETDRILPGQHRNPAGNGIRRTTAGIPNPAGRIHGLPAEPTASRVTTMKTIPEDLTDTKAAQRPVAEVIPAGSTSTGGQELPAAAIPGDIPVVIPAAIPAATPAGHTGRDLLRPGREQPSPGGRLPLPGPGIHKSEIPGMGGRTAERQKNQCG